MTWLMPDISHWQGSHTREDMVQVSTVAASIMFKASQGIGFVDDEFVSNAEAANGAGLPYGAYHFVDPGEGRAQADHFREVVSRVPGCAFLCIDWEAGSRETVQALADRLLGTVTVPVGDYIGSHARANGGQLPGMAFHMVPQYGPAELDPRFATDPLSAWQYTDGDVNGTDWPAGVPGIGKCDMSAVLRPEDFGFGGDMALTQDDVQRVAKATADAIAGRKIRADGLIVEQAWRDANMTRNAVAALAGDVANWDDVVIANLRTALTEELSQMELGDLSVNEVAETVAQKLAERLSA